MTARKREPKAEINLKDKSRGERLQKVLADAGVASRRAAEELIAKGSVEINGAIVTDLPAWVNPEADHIVVDGRPIPKSKPRHIYILLNKPARTLSTVEDEPGVDRRTVTDLVDHPSAPRLFPVGRLDYDTLGLILLTNDGELANRLTHPRYGVPKTYRVKLKGKLGPDAAKQIEEGIYLADRKEGQTVGASRTSHIEIAIIRTERDATHVELTLREGRNRQVRRMLAAVGFPVLKLERIGMGPLQLRGVARGQWRELTSAEIRNLRQAAAVPGSATEPKAARGGKAGGAKKGRSSKSPKGSASSAAKSRASGGSRAPKNSSVDSDLGPESPTIKRRTMKNALNRAGREGQPRG
ncbi:MAG: 23S rRNA pseudouridine2605 synthase [Phycisphaerales bacterium]|jgi:23S rRNA pseudouridine2605 synthase